VRVRDAVFVIGETRRQLEDRIGALAREHATRCEIASVAHARHREAQRRAGSPGAQEVAVDRVDAPMLDGLHRSHRGLRSRQTAEESPHPAGGRGLEDSSPTRASATRASTRASGSRCASSACCNMASG
jgi:hypothetical protein